ncbi:hypothetical protein [Halosimplex amylolyticum]|uniref:hypothetical protein n=1 Tax=Halosimplex amylolyticum TaxID=3396616 RepID=UPI003F57FC68
MTQVEICDQHVWAALGIVSRDGSVSRVWECEDCPVWTTEPFDPEYERDWDDTWLAGR